MVDRVAWQKLLLLPMLVSVTAYTDHPLIITQLLSVKIKGLLVDNKKNEEV